MYLLGNILLHWLAPSSSLSQIIHCYKAEMLVATSSDVVVKIAGRAVWAIDVQVMNKLKQLRPLNQE